jgi:hypothetical protein
MCGACETPEAASIKDMSRKYLRPQSICDNKKRDMRSEIPPLQWDFDGKLIYTVIGPESSQREELAGGPPST